jgi:hypothetical protein
VGTVQLAAAISGMRLIPLKSTVGVVSEALQYDVFSREAKAF